MHLKSGCRATAPESGWHFKFEVGFSFNFDFDSSIPNDSGLGEIKTLNIAGATASAPRPEFQPTCNVHDRHLLRELRQMYAKKSKFVGYSLFDHILNFN